jgi:hypothetical protein
MIIDPAPKDASFETYAKGEIIMGNLKFNFSSDLKILSLINKSFI